MASISDIRTGAPSVESGGTPGRAMPNGRGPMSELLILALTLWGEARGESLLGKFAVADVVLTRSASRGQSISEVCKEPRQFSCWDAGRPEADYLSKEWRDCLFVARKVMEKGYQIKVDADHYHAKSVRPIWVVGMKRVERIGNHVFYRANS